MRKFKFSGFSFKNTPLEVREQLTFNEAEAKQLIQILKTTGPLNDLLVLSTCNRTEIYYSSSKDCLDHILHGITMIKALSKDFIKPYFTSITDHDLVVRHLFNVAAGLEAQVVGDMQITNQVKNAYQWSADEDAAGPFLHRLMHTIFFTNKRIVQETTFRDGAASVSYAAKELAEDVMQGRKDARTLILGIGEIGLDVCRNFSGAGFTNVVIANRTRKKSESLAQECNYEVQDFKTALENINEFDVVVSSVVKEEPVIAPELLKSEGFLTHKLFIDLSLPRSIDPAVEHIPGVLLYNVDNIRSKATEALRKRKAAIPQVEAIIENVIEEFEDWSKEMLVSPTIKKFKETLEEIRKEEVTRFLKDATEDEAQMMEKVTKSMMQKIMKLPVLQLKAACKRGEAESLISVLNDLFDLERTNTPKL